MDALAGKEFVRLKPALRIRKLAAVKTTKVCKETASSLKRNEALIGTQSACYRMECETKRPKS